LGVYKLAVNNPYKQYKKTQIDTANQGKLIILLYEGAIKHINKAIELIPEFKIEEIHNNIIKAQEIVSELMVSLNMEAGDISSKLFSIYLYINKRLLEANVSKKEEPLVEVRKYLLELKSAWEEASKKITSDVNNSDTGGINIAT
jgi:flagellar secretion chaperone FliS